MASGYRETMCNRMQTELDAAISKLKMLTSTITNKVDELRTELLTIAAQPASNLNDLLDAIDEVSSEAESSLPPSVTDDSEMDDVIQNCPYLKNLYGAYTDSEKLVQQEIDQAINEAKKNFNDYIDNTIGGSGGWVETINTFGDKIVNAAKEAGEYASNLANDTSTAITAKLDTIKSTIPEMGIDDLRESIESQLSGLLIDQLKDTIDQLLECLTAVCGIDVSSEISEVNTALEDAGLDVNGNLDLDTLMDDAGLTADHKTNINESTDKLKEVRTSTQESAANIGKNYLNTLKNKYF